MYYSKLKNDHPPWIPKFSTKQPRLLCGALANHPPAGVQPNVMYYTCVCDLGSLPAPSAAVLRRISWYDMPALTRDGRSQHVVVLVALRDLADEELFVNYEYEANADAALPSWYHPVDA